MCVNNVFGVRKIIEDTGCSIETALAWAVNAKNSLQNIYGFSPYQLVFGRNPTLPSVFTDKLPALEGVTSSQLVADHLNAMHAMRREFVRLESCEKVRRALRSKVRSHAKIRYLSGEDVFYKREDETKWLGPARVIGQDGSKILLKIPTGPITVHSSCVRLTSDAELKRREGESVEGDKPTFTIDQDAYQPPVERQDEQESENNVETIQLRRSRRNLDSHSGEIDDVHGDGEVAEVHD